MRCWKCEKRFNEAGNVKDYLYTCPHCGYAHTSNASIPKSDNKTNTKKESERDASSPDNQKNESDKSE